ncbi:MAG: glycosyltransferase family 2 protein, partial [Blastocatellia bacterium]
MDLSVFQYGEVNSMEVESGVREHDVSIVIPTFNRARLLPDAIDSCIRQKAGYGLDIQVIVVDDCSTDRTAELLREYGTGIQAISFERNAGHIVARNEGQKRA